MSSNVAASNSWNPQGLSRPVQGLLYLFTIFFSSLTLYNTSLFTRSFKLISITIFQNLQGDKFSCTMGLPTAHCKNLCAKCESSFIFLVLPLKDKTRNVRKCGIPRGPTSLWHSLRVRRKYSLSFSLTSGSKKP